MPRNSLSSLEIIKLQTKADPDLEALPAVKANLLSRTRGLQKQGLSQDQMDVAAGLILCRRALLTCIPSGRLGTPEGMNLVVRILEQLHKGQSALRRQAGRGGQGQRSPIWRTPPTRRLDSWRRGPDVPKDEPEAAGAVPVDDDADDDAAGGEA